VTRRRPVRYTPEATAHAAEVDLWWKENRTKAPDLFVEELRAAESLLARSPRAGQPHESEAMPGVRRLLLLKTRFHVYYIIAEKEIVIVAVWSAVRKQGPPLGDLH
jgi:plasmid stabilization system protein ParE